MQFLLPFERLRALVAPEPSPRASTPGRDTREPAARALPGAPLTFVRHPRARRYVLRVASDGSVRVTLPRWGSKREATAFVRAEAAWIERQRARLARERDAQTRRTPVDPEAERALRQRAKHELPVRLLELAARHGCVVSRITIRNQRSRWGSCSRKGHISLNWRLVEMPDMVRDYVMIHELMHLKRMDHSPAFWKLVKAACPDVTAARQWLRKVGRVASEA